MNLTTKELLAARLPRTEGRRAKPYKDTVGKWTVGVGHNVTDNGLPGYAVVELIEHGSLSDNSIDRLLGEDIDKALKDAGAIPVFKTLDPVRQSVLADMVFNMGLGSVLGFQNTLACIARADWENAAKNMLKSKWAEQVGNRAVELAELMRSGQIKSPKALV
jgi:lysozyme